MFIVELEGNVWLAPWSGDPGRTIVVDHARKYDTKRGAKIALGVARKYRKFKEARVIPLNDIQQTKDEIPIFCSDCPVYKKCKIECGDTQKCRELLNRHFNHLS